MRVLGAVCSFNQFEVTGMTRPGKISAEKAGFEPQVYWCTRLLVSFLLACSITLNRLAGLVVKASASGEERSRVRIPLATGFFRVESYQ